MFSVGGETNTPQKCLNEKRLLSSNGKFTTIKVYSYSVTLVTMVTCTI